MNFKKKSMFTICAMAGVTVLLLCGLIVTGAYVAKANTLYPTGAQNTNASDFDRTAPDEKGTTVIEMELSGSYDDSDPFINESLFFVTRDADRLDFNASFQMECESGLLEIADNETKEVLWYSSWNHSADEDAVIPLKDLEKEKEYVIRLTCTKVEYVRLVMTADSSLVKERERPLNRAANSGIEAPGLKDSHGEILSLNLEKYKPYRNQKNG